MIIIIVMTVIIIIITLILSGDPVQQDKRKQRESHEQQHKIRKSKTEEIRLTGLPELLEQQMEGHSIDWLHQL